MAQFWYTFKKNLATIAGNQAQKCRLVSG
jgi:hypothetical protein